MIKWCSYCNKTDHNDNDCWSTRGQNGPDRFWFLGDADIDGDSPINETYDAIWIRAIAAFDSASGNQRGFSEWQERLRAAVRVLASSAPEVLAAEMRLSTGRAMIKKGPRSRAWLRPRMSRLTDAEMQSVDRARDHPLRAHYAVEQRPHGYVLLRCRCGSPWAISGRDRLRYANG